jgi:hypothetical protein
MAINFPSSPIDDQTYTENNTSWYYDSSVGAWLAVVPNTTVNITNDNVTDNTYFITLTSSSSGSISTLNVSSTKLTFNPNTGTLSATIFNSLSDREYKANIKTLINSLDVVDNFRGVSFNWKDNGQASIGVIAQEIETYVPALVTDNNGIKNVNYDGIIGLLIESIKELKSRIEVLENKDF